MANLEIQQILQDISAYLKSVINTNETRDINNFVPRFNGDSKEFKAWLKSIEKYAKINDLNDESKKKICFQQTTGPVSDFVHRFLDENLGCSWNVLKTALTSRFSEVFDPQHALYLLGQIRQKEGENIYCFVERILSLAEDAYSADQAQNGQTIIEQQLIGFFIDGLTEDGIRLKLLRENPQNLQIALKLATTEHAVMTKYQSSCQRKADVFDRSQRNCQCSFRHVHSVNECRKGQISTCKVTDRNMQNKNQSQTSCKYRHIKNNCVYKKRGPGPLN